MSLPALSKPTRPATIRVLHDGGEHCVRKLMRRLDVSQSWLSRHMQALQNVGPVSDRPGAQWLRDRVSPDLPSPQRALMAVAVVEAVTA